MNEISQRSEIEKKRAEKNADEFYHALVQTMQIGIAGIELSQQVTLDHVESHVKLPRGRIMTIKIAKDLSI